MYISSIINVFWTVRLQLPSSSEATPRLTLWTFPVVSWHPTTIFSPFCFKLLRPLMGVYSRIKYRSNSYFVVVDDMYTFSPFLRRVRRVDNIAELSEDVRRMLQLTWNRGCCGRPNKQLPATATSLMTWTRTAWSYTARIGRDSECDHS